MVEYWDYKNSRKRYIPFLTFARQILNKAHNRGEVEVFFSLIDYIRFFTFYCGGGVFRLQYHMSKKQIPLKAKVALVAACIFWAISFVASKEALDHVPPLTVVMLRLIISALCFLLWFVVKGERVHLKKSWWGYLFMLSLFGTGLHYGIQTIGLTYTSAANASVYTVMGPISIIIIAAVFLRERVTWLKFVGIGCALIGVVAVMGLNTLTSLDFKGNLLGDLLVIASIFMWGFFTVMGKRMLGKMEAIKLAAVVTIMGAIYMVPVGLLEIQNTPFSLFTIPGKAWAAIAFLGITCSFLATIFYCYALAGSESQKVGVYLYMIPPITAVIAHFYRGEVIGLNFVFGTLLVLGGVYITEKG